MPAQLSLSLTDLLADIGLKQLQLQDADVRIAELEGKIVALEDQILRLQGTGEDATVLPPGYEPTE
jgi:hypothetical protein